MNSINKHLHAQIEKMYRNHQQRYEASVDKLARAIAANANATNEMQRNQTQVERNQWNYEQQFYNYKIAIESYLGAANARNQSCGNQ